MYVCLCNAITDREIRGAAAARRPIVRDLSAMLGVATCCRALQPTARAKCSANALPADRASRTVGND